MIKVEVIGNFVKFDSWVNISRIENIWSEEDSFVDERFCVKYTLIDDKTVYDLDEEFIQEEDTEFYIKQFLEYTRQDYYKVKEEIKYMHKKEAK